MKRMSKLLVLLSLILSLLPLMAVPAAAAEDYLTVEDAIPLLRESLANHESRLVLKVATTEKDPSALGAYMYQQAYIHTGEPTMGDYIRFHIQEASPASVTMPLGGTYCITFTFSPGFMTSVQQEDMLNTKYQQVMAQLDLDGKSDYQKVLAIYRYITETVRYDYTNKSNPTYLTKFTAYGAMMHGTAVCQGYANLFYRMANDAGLDCRIVTGSGNGEAHAWNIVLVDGAYYLADSTWDEGISPEDFRWFLKGTENFPKHTLDSDYLSGDFAKNYPISATDYDPTLYCTHTDTILENAKEPTCTDSGYTGDQVCAICGKTMESGSGIAPAGHTEAVDAAVIPTCMETGLTEGKHCTVCGLVLVQQEVVPMTGHTWDAGTVTREPTENKPGERVYRCTQCVETKTEPIPSLLEGSCAHESTNSTGALEASCEAEGYTGDVVCILCGKVLEIGEPIPALGHLWDEGIVTQEPSCNQEGKAVYTCTRCGGTKTEVLPALSDGFVVVDSPDTVVSQGFQVYDPITGKKESFAYEIPENGATILIFFSHLCGNSQHLMSTLDTCRWMANPYLNVVAVESKATGPAPVMDFISIYTPNSAPLIDYSYAGSTKLAFRYYGMFSSQNSLVWPVVLILTDSGDVATVRYGADRAIDTDAIYNALCCTSPAFAEYENGEEPGGNSCQINGHSWDQGTVTLEPTHTAAGIKTYICTVCGESREESLPVISCDHSASVTLRGELPPTCTKEGYSGDRVCDLCGETLSTGEAIPATGHSWDEGTVTREPTTEQDGEKTYACTNGCGETKTESIPMLTADGFRRVAGANRFETAFAVADTLKETLGVAKFDTVIVASGSSFADALSGSYLAAMRNAPILLSFTTDAINNQVKDYIHENLAPGGTVYILGGPKAVPESMESGLDAFTVKRLAGDDRFGTNLAILEEAGYDGKAILVCTGIEYADSLSASAPGLPILLVWRSLTDDQKAFLDSISGSLYVIGGEGAISNDLMRQVAEYGHTERLGGKNRFETSVLIARTFFPDAKAAALAYAWGFPDGLCGGALAAAMDVPLVLTMNCYEAQAAEYAAENGITGGVVFGTAKLISDESVNAVAGLSAPGHHYTSETVDPTFHTGGYTLHTCGKCGHSYRDSKTDPLGQQ